MLLLLQNPEGVGALCQEWGPSLVLISYRTTPALSILSPDALQCPGRVASQVLGVTSTCLFLGSPFWNQETFPRTPTASRCTL